MLKLKIIIVIFILIVITTLGPTPSKTQHPIGRHMLGPKAILGPAPSMTQL